MTDLFEFRGRTGNTLDEILALLGGDGYITLNVNRIFESREDAEREYARIGFAKSTKARVSEIGHYSDRDENGRWVPDAPTRTIWRISVHAQIGTTTRTGGENQTMKGANEGGMKRLAAFVAKVTAAA